MFHPYNKPGFMGSFNAKQGKKKTYAVHKGSFYPAYIIQVMLNKRTVITTWSCQANHRKSAIIKQGKQQQEFYYKPGEIFIVK